MSTCKNVNQIEKALLDRLYKAVRHNTAPVRNSASFLHKFIITRNTLACYYQRPLMAELGSMGNRVWVVPDPTNNSVRDSECPRQKSGSCNR